MTAGEVHRPVLEPTRSATPSITRAWSHLADVAGAKPDHAPSQSQREHRDESLADAVAALLASDDSVPPDLRQAIESLLQRHRQLQADVARLRAQREEWIVNVLTYQALYHRYSGQTLHAPSDRLMRERDSMRRTIREQLRSGTTPTAMFDLPSPSVSSV